MEQYMESELLLPLCPFWRDPYGSMKNRMIGCEGLTEDSSINLNFKSQQSRKLHFSIFCCEHYRNCEIYRAIVEAKYWEELGCGNE